MSEFDPTPDIEESRQRWQAEMDTFDRVYAVARGITAPTAYTEIAEIADCAPNTAKKHLERLAEMGIVSEDAESRPARYERNEGYLEWQEASRIASELSIEQIVDRVQALETERDEYEAEFGTTDPAAVSVFDHDNHETIHQRMESVSDWHGVIRNIRLYELARQLSQNDGHLIPA